MNWGLVVSALVVIIGWGVVHKLNSARDVSIKRRDITIQYLIQAYHRIQSAANRQLDDPEDEEQMRCKREFEDALGDIQLLGSDEQIRLSREIAESLVATNRVDAKSMDDLLVSLRGDLRAELLLPQTDEPLMHLRINLRPAGRDKSPRTASPPAQEP